MKLNVNEWKEFKVNELLNVTKAFAYNRETFLEETAEPELNCVTRTAINNGVAYKGVREAGLKVEKGNCLTIGGEGVVCFYQKSDFVAGTNISVLRLDNMNDKVGLFIASVINHYSKGRFSYGRAFNMGQIEKSIIKLPILRDPGTNDPILDPNKKYSSEGYIPDFEYMENYIKSLNHKPITTACGVRISYSWV